MKPEHNGGTTRHLQHPGTSVLSFEGTENWNLAGLVPKKALEITIQLQSCSRNGLHVDSQRVYDWLQDIFLWWFSNGTSQMLPAD